MKSRLEFVYMDDETGRTLLGGDFLRHEYIDVTRLDDPPNMRRMKWLRPKRADELGEIEAR